jgi:ribokinase
VSDQCGTTPDNLAARSAAKVIVVGSYGVGLSLTMERMPEAGETVTGEQFSTGHGGKGSNQAVAVARLGATAVLCTAVGSDAFGEQAKALWADEGVDFTMVRTLPGSTMVGVILVDAAGENRIALAPGVLADYTADCLDGLVTALTDADVLLVGLEIPVDTAHEALRLGRDAGVVTILNPAPAPPVALPAGMLALADHVTPNRTEAARLAGLPTDSDPAVLVGAACFADVGTTVLTLGRDGALIRQGDAVDKIDAVVARHVVDTTGAGDAFNGAYAVSLAGDLAPIDAARFAARAASWCVSRREVIPSLALRSDLEPEPCPA